MGSDMMLGAQAYGWSQAARDEGEGWPDGMEWAMRQAAGAGVACWEPLFNDAADVPIVGEMARRNGLVMHSIYMGGALHDAATAADSVASMTAIAEQAKVFGTRLAVVNPNPIEWGQPLDKSDDQLGTQLNAMTDLAGKLHDLGLALCYHTHDAEMRAGARELHHMLARTDPALVRYCLDPEWVYRGAGHSQHAVMDLIALYGDRIDEVHVRQSVNHVWSETVGEGDLDYRAILEAIGHCRPEAHLVVEIAREEQTRHTMTPAEAHRQSLAYIDAIMPAAMRRAGFELRHG